MQQVLWNLIKNAMKFTPAEGVVTVRSRDGEGNSRGTTGTSLILEVSDTGIGIEPDVLSRIFDNSEREGLESSHPATGLGLGLSISRSIVEQHGGRLAATSGGKNRGATFAVEMPSVAPPRVVHLHEETRTPMAVIPPWPLTILLVDDNADTLNYLSKLLTLRGHTVHTADSVDSAMQVATDVDFDVLVSDIELPDGTGLELMSQLRANCTFSGIALSGFGSPEDIELSHQAGFSEHLTKPVDFRKLEKSIQQVASFTRDDGLVIR